jgi:hypothetical protein
MENPALQVARKRVEERARCLRDKFFLAEVLGFDFQPECHAELFACFVQYDRSKAWVDQSEIKDRMVLWSRGHFKTTAVIVDIIQCILNFPNIRILLMQGSVPLTKLLLRQILAQFTGEAFGSRLQELFPEYCGDKKQMGATAMSFTTPARTQKQLPQATVSVSSQKAVKASQHYDAGYFDDLVNDQNFRNPKQILKLQGDFTLAQALIDPGGYRFLSGTRYAFGDLYEQIQRWQATSGKWIISIKDCWTDESGNLPDSQKVPRLPRFVKKNGQQGGFTTEQLLQMQADDPQNFANQYLNRPMAASQAVFTEDMFTAASVAANDAPALSSAIMVCDLAATDTERSDDNVIAVGKVDNLGIGYLVDLRGGQWSPMDMAMHVIDVFLRHRAHRICFEGSSAAKYFVDFLKLVAKQKNVYLPIEEIKVDNRPDAKNMRVSAFAGVVRRGRFRFFRGLSNFEKFVEQACEFPKGRSGHDDYPDTGALLYKELTKELLTQTTRNMGSKPPILAMIENRENALFKTLTKVELGEVSAPDQTGLEN